jgi:PST family polysaccharide transporter
MNTSENGLLPQNSESGDSKNAHSNFLTKICNPVVDKLSSRFVQNIGWMGIAEIINRLSRLVTAIVLARFLTAQDYGVAAIALTCYELIRVLTNNGLGARIIQASDEDLAVICNTAYRINWLLNGSLLIFQCVIAFPVAWFYQDDQLAWMLITLAMIYLIYPLSLVQVYLIQREQRLKITALALGLSISLDNLLTALMAFCGAGVWAVIFPKLLVAPVWVLICRHHMHWKPTKGAGFQRWEEILAFGKHVLGVELLKTLRLNLDNLIIGRFLGLEALGIYYFARSAGIGLSMSILTAYSTAVLPHLAMARGNLDILKHKYFTAIKTAGIAVSAIILLQSIMAPFYVPLIFGERWIELGALPILILLCLSAVPRPLGESTSQLLRVLDKPHIDFYWSIIFTLLFTLSIFAGMPWGLMGVATAVFVIHMVAIPMFSYWTYRRFLHKTNLNSSEKTFRTDR